MWRHGAIAVIFFAHVRCSALASGRAAILHLLLPFPYNCQHQLSISALHTAQCLLTFSFQQRRLAERQPSVVQTQPICTEVITFLKTHQPAIQTAQSLSDVREVCSSREPPPLGTSPGLSAKLPATFVPFGCRTALHAIYFFCNYF